MLSTSKGGKVTVGGWTDFWTGITYRDIDATGFHIDRIIPVCFAWHHGASAWSKEKRRTFYNDMSLLVVVGAGQNRRKNDLMPSAFMPQDRARACGYIARFQAGAAHYGLTPSARERTDLENARAMICSGIVPPRI